MNRNHDRITRRWEVRCLCPDCGEVMGELMYLAEQVYDLNGETFVDMTPGFAGNSGDQFTCPLCKVRHDPRKLTPQLIQTK